MKKEAALEETEVVDPSSGKPIRVSTTTRLLWRKSYPEEYGHMRNARLNVLIAEEFADKANQVVHYFRLGKTGKARSEFEPPGAEEGKVYADVGEIRGDSSFYYISAIRSDSIDILTIQNAWVKPKYRAMEVGEEGIE